MGRLGPGLKRGWTPSPVRAARRIAQMNAARRAREAERVAIVWDLVEEQGLTLEQLTTRVRRDLVTQAKWIQQCLDQKDERVPAETTTVPAADGAVADNSPAQLGPEPAPGGSRAVRTARPCARGPVGGAVGAQGGQKETRRQACTGRRGIGLCDGNGSRR